MSSVEFALVDVFAEAPLTGNALAVVPDAEDLDVATMRAVAREFNQSETTFLLRPDDAAVTWWLRSFTAAGHEVAGAGHNALGAWIWLAHAGRVGPGEFTQRIGPDVLPVQVSADRVVMRQSAPEYGREAGDRAALAAALGLAEADLADRPAQVVSTGAGHLLVPLTDRAAVDRVAVDTPRLRASLAGAGGEGCYVYTTDGTDAQAYARFFNPTMGIAEDPATGTAAGPLAAQLVRLGDADPARPVLIRQGDATGRPSLIRIDVSGTDVTISGTGLVVASGHLRIR